MSRKQKKSLVWVYPRMLSALKLRYWLFGLAIGGVFGGLVAAVLLSGGNAEPPIEPAAYHPETSRVAEKFLCGCPDCSMDLLACQCDAPDGGVREMRFISALLQAGRPAPQVVRAVYEKFGKIKEAYRDQVAATNSERAK